MSRAARRRWRTWKRAQRSQIQYALIPDRPIITAAGLAYRQRIVEVHVPAMF